MERVYKNCLVCGKRYEACAFCDSQNSFYAWRSVVCSPEHFVYHLPIIKYIRKQVSKEDAREELLLAETQNGKIQYAADIQSVVDEIKGNDTPNTSKANDTEDKNEKPIKRARKPKNG